MTAIKTPTDWFLYLIRNKNQHLYTGISNNWQRRYFEHAEQGAKCAKALRGKAPLEIVFCAALANKNEALRAEVWVKKQSRKTKLAIIENTAGLPFDHHRVTQLQQALDKYHTQQQG